MSQKLPYPKRPIRTVWLMFLGFSALFAISLLFQPDIPPQAWPLALAYFALLPACAVGIARLGRRVFLTVAALSAGLVVFGMVGVALMLHNGSSLSKGYIWLRISLYLFYTLGVFALVLGMRGWVLYWRETHEAR